MFASQHARSSLSAVVFRLLLVVSLWQGQVVWGHQHQADSSSMAEHIARYHAGDPNAWNLGWHWHLSNACGGQPIDDTQGRHDFCPHLSVNPILLASQFSSGQTLDASDWVAFLPVSRISAPVAYSGMGSEPQSTAAVRFQGPPEQLCRMNC